MVTFLPVVQVAVEVVLVDVVERVSIESSGLVVDSQPDDVVALDVPFGLDSNHGAAARSGLNGRRRVLALHGEAVVVSLVLEIQARTRSATGIGAIKLYASVIAVVCQLACYTTIINSSL